MQAEANLLWPAIPHNHFMGKARRRTQSPRMSKIPSPADENSGQQKALARYAAVQMVLRDCQNGLSFTQALQRAAQQPWDGQFYAPSTLEGWCYRYRHGHFAALHPQPRRDKGQHKALDPAATHALLELRRQHPQMTLVALVEELLRKGILQKGAFSMSTLQRRLAEAGLDRKSLKAGAAILGGPTKAFELPLPNLLWMADCMHGPVLKLQDGSTQPTFLFALLDDCSRLCVHAQFYAHERLECFLDTLRQALKNRGVPDKLYTDNGAAFRSQHLSIVCANLGIKLLHAKPYAAWSKGKLERYFLTLQTQFLSALAFEPVHDLATLNTRLWRWIETEYHQRRHSSLDGESPAQRFAGFNETLRLLPAHLDLERLFLMRLPRRVRKDATISLAGVLWEVPVHLRGQVVMVHFDPIGFSRVEIWIGERFIAPAIRCDKQSNAQHFSSHNYDKQPPLF